MFPFSTFQSHREYAEGEGWIDLTNSFAEKGMSKTFNDDAYLKLYVAHLVLLFKNLKFINR